MNQEAYNSLIGYFHHYNANKEYLKNHKPSDEQYDTCLREVHTAETALQNIRERDEIAAEIIKEVHVNGEKLSKVAKRHHQSIGDALKRSSWAIVDEVSMKTGN